MISCLRKTRELIINDFKKQKKMRYEDSIKQYHHSVSQEFQNAGGRVVSQKAQPLNNSDRTLTVQLALIDTTVVGACRIFGANIDLDETYNTANNMTVTIPESSHKQVKSSTLGSPFRIKGLIYEVSLLAQLAKPFVVVDRSVAGATQQMTWQPSNFTDPRNFNSLMIKTSQFQTVINANMAIEIVFVATATATMILTINEVIELSQALSGKTPIKAASTY